MPSMDPNDPEDQAEAELIGRTLSLTSSVFGFPEFRSLVELRDDASVRWFGGMISKEPGKWCVVSGDPNEGEDPKDLYVQFSQPLTQKYIDAFNIQGEQCFWRGKLDIRPRDDVVQVSIDGGVVCSEFQDGTKLVREGIFTGVTVDEEQAEDIRKRNREAFERALTTPKGETTGFKTPARIAGVQRKRKALPKGEKEDVDLLEDDKK